MKYICCLFLIVQALSMSYGFSPMASSGSAIVSSLQRTTSSSIVLNAEKKKSSSGTERGVSVDQDGKSNVWAIEPKMEVSTKSSEEKTKSALLAGAGLVLFAGLAGFALTHLPDPNQF
mmetsp:Transcript_50560/g.56498  ORF Transcript_50560/g.56498 Transcript_50560/m.56498 type:complete len:118 (+) Transcript_50560:78-431(+)|eukprot:CAMPEP_0170797168 /NCGR_PEP_ID=MMETSP0733-20121128/25403_1 /TAXON_ID=186038 /ORGANISM="Fragilariopsis kerguelensis, Strain L26-C5" /LENGTH=117 /DNA_ID=CAMNT_0011147885 /DNA_START=104 /DNA_END=457 /DNA_ORIENTATION=+